MLYILLLLFLGIACPSLALPKTAWSCSVPSNTTLVPDIELAEAQYGSASYIHGGLVEPWPAFTTRDGRRLRGFRYCFETRETKDILTCDGGKFWEALVLWHMALGKAGEASGHSFAWQEASNSETDNTLFETYFCYHDLREINPALGLIWNERVPDDTLAIRVIKDSTQSWATVGYKGINQGTHPHELTLGSKASAAVIAHELGHVMGMVHEHTRNDRDQHVRFNCHSLMGYDDALGRAISKRIPPAEAQKKLCQDAEFAREYGFQSAAFLKNDRLSTEPDKWGALDEPGGYDIDSIMHYSSYAFGDIIACIESEARCPLLRIKQDAQGKEIGTARISMPVKPSKGDVEWVKRNYCWPADGDCKL